MDPNFAGPVQPNLKLPKGEGLSSQEDLKGRINILIWMFSPDTITLKEADNRALKIMDIIEDGPGS